MWFSEEEKERLRKLKTATTTTDKITQSVKPKIQLSALSDTTTSVPKDTAIAPVKETPVNSLLSKFAGQFAGQELTQPVTKKTESIFDRFKGQELTQTPEKSTTKPKISESEFVMKEMLAGKTQHVKDPKTGKYVITSPEIEMFRNADDKGRAKLLDLQVKESPLSKFFEGTEVGKKTLSVITGAVTNIPLKAKSLVESIGSLGAKSYSDIYAKKKEAREAPGKSFIKELAYNVQDVAPQVIIGAGLSLIPGVGKPLASSYFATLSLSEEVKKEGGFSRSTAGNVVIDVVLDRVLGDMLGSMLKTPPKLLNSKLLSLLKMGTVEGGTEVTQSFLKYANEYQNANTDKEKAKIMDEAKNYISSGAMAQEFLAGAISGGVVAGGGLAAGQISPQLQETGGTIKPIETATKTEGIQLQSLSDVANPVQLPQRELDSSQATNISRLAETTEAKALANNISEDLGNLPEYNTMNMADQAAQALNLINTDLESAIAISLGQAQPQGDLRVGSVYKAVEQYAIQNSNVDLIQKLVQSTVTTQFSALGQEIKALDSGLNNTSPINAIKSIQSNRGGKASQQNIRKVAQQVKSEINKPLSNKQNWVDFVKSLQC
jgi:hypothetical protein